MVNPLFHKRIHLGWVLALLCTLLPGLSLAQGLGGGGAQAQLIALQQKLHSLSEALQSDPDMRRQPMDALRAALGLDAHVPARSFDTGGAALIPAVPNHPANAQVINFRIALAILSQSYGGKDNLDVLLAQPDERTQAVSFRKGRVTLQDILRETRQIAAPTAQGALRAPVILWEDTLLQLSPADRLSLSRPDGAFVISFGRVEISGSILESVGDVNPRSEEFVPFVTVAGGGSLSMTGARVTGLGFGNTEKFSGLSVAANPLMRKTGETLIQSSHFEDLATVSIVGKTGAVLRANSFHLMRNNALLLAAAPFGVVEANLFFAHARTNAIRLLNGSSDVQVVGNMILEGDRAGIIVHGRSDNVLLRDNVIWRRDGGAIKFSKTQCGVAQDNLVLDSRQKGIEVRASENTRVIGNQIVGSRNAGIWVSAQRAAAVTQIDDNVLHANKAGLTMATGGAVRMAGNDFSAQMPRLLGGDVALHSVAIIRNLRGETPVLLSAAGSATLSDAEAFACPPHEGL